MHCASDEPYGKLHDDEEHAHGWDMREVPLHEPMIMEKDGSKAPKVSSHLSAVLWTLCCAFACVVGMWISCFVIVCVLLYHANTPEVHEHCAGYWDFMLASQLSPVLLPFGYCLVVCLWRLSWRLFSGVCMATLAFMLMWMTTNAGTNSACVQALRETSPPVPWLLVIGWLEAAGYGASAWVQLKH